MSGDEPDFRALARAWVANDSRLTRLLQEQPDQAEGLITRLAEALRLRRSAVKEEAAPLEEGLSPTGNLIVSVDRERIGPSGLDPEAIDDLADILRGLGEGDEPPPG